MSNTSKAAAERSLRPRYLLRDVAGVDQLIAHLTTHVKLPRIEVAVDAFPPVDAHRARARIAHYAGKSGFTAGGMVAGLVVMISAGILIPTTYRDWNYLLGWGMTQNLAKLAWMVVPALCAGVMVYLGVELWIRVKLLRELQRLRRQSAGWAAAHEVSMPPGVQSADIEQVDLPGDRFEVLSRLSELHIVQLHALYQREWWSRERSLDETRRGVKGSQVVIGLVNESNELVAFVRVLTDYTFKALIFDVIVAESSRNLQLGRRLMHLVTDHEALQQVRHFELYCLPDLVDFYVPHGFSTEVGNIRLMRRCAS